VLIHDTIHHQFRLIQPCNNAGEVQNWPGPIYENENVTSN
jgi:hypothetical protein